MKKLLFFILAGVAALVAYQALMIYDNHFRYGRMRETPAVRPHEQPLLAMTPGVVPVNGGDPVFRRTPAAELASPLDSGDAAVIERGQALYRVYCAHCHGPQYDGNGTVGQSFAPLPTDLRSSIVLSKTDGQLFKSISYGIPGGRQPALDTTISPQDRWYIIAFIRSLDQGPTP